MSAPEAVTTTLVLPAYQAGDFIAASLAQLSAWLEHHGDALGAVEILVVDDGSRDDTAQRAAAHPGVRVVRLPRNRGKGAAVRSGMLAARGAVRIFTDCDLPYDLSVLLDMSRRLREGSCDVAIGARHLEGSTWRRRPALPRRTASAVFTFLVSRLSVPGFRDTQCGVKAFSESAAEALFGEAAVDGFAFDVEVLYLARKWGLRIERFPVQHVADSPSSVRMLLDPLRMLRDLVAIPLRYRLRRRGRREATG